MSNNPLNIVSVEKNHRPSQDLKGHSTDRIVRRRELQAKLERMWLIDPEQFDPLRNCMERERIERTWKLIREHVQLKDKNVADLGCGIGTLSRLMAESGAKVHALDIANKPLNTIQQHPHVNIEIFQDYIPWTHLQDEFYSLVVSTDVIAFLFPDDYRLYFSELSRLMAPNGVVVCSTPLDISSDDALQNFADLAETEFKIHKWVLSYHFLYIRIKNFLGAPARFVKASQNPEFFQQEIARRRGLKQTLFRWNSRSILAFFWRIISWISTPLYNFFKQNRTLMLSLERISRFIWSERGISHAIFLAERKPLISPSPEEPPIERKHKKEVWE